MGNQYVSCLLYTSVDRPKLLAHDLADEGWTDSGIKAIYYQFAADEDSLKADWLTYDAVSYTHLKNTVSCSSRCFWVLQLFLTALF